MKGIINIPNIITCLNLISGCVATYWAFQGIYDFALIFIVAGAVFDFFDGMAARLLGVSSPIGKELDSLADVVTFGVAPSAMVFTFLYQSILNSSLSSGGGWEEAFPFLAFLMAAFSALRLAKFNLDERQAMGFIGLPTPANALFWASLIVGTGDWLHTLPYAIWLLTGMLFVSCWLLVSEIPMFALKFKQWGWRGNEIRYIFLLSCLPILAFFGIVGIAVVIAWYVLLSILSPKKRPTAPK
ncbi:MAG: CDP-alcohol phosphatidyltransferase family protein [Prevotella sp.]|nr:CDP-alcohol phosphatidyltransferase family protein [Prevotella sp.]